MTHDTDNLSELHRRPTLRASWHRRADAADVGTKAAGLLRLPRRWVPPWASIRTPAGMAPHALEELLDLERPHVMRNVLCGARHVLVRSDGPAESSRPGAGRSLIVDANWEAVRAAMLAAARRVPCHQLLQRAVEPALVGALSNSRTLAPDARTWIAEGALDLSRPRIRDVHAFGAADVEEPLAVADVGELPDALRRIAVALLDGDTRLTCEWLWDGSNVWVVQADRLPDRSTGAAAARMLRAELSAPASYAADGSDSSWEGPKTRSRDRFGAFGWPTVPLSARSALTLLDEQARLRWIRDELDHHCSPLVVRFDAMSALNRSRPLLPTSVPSTNAERLSDFVIRAIRDLGRAGLTPADCGVLVSPLVRAQASVLAHASPEHTKVVLDALWGFPDGLLSLPHDTFQIDGDSMRASVRFKPACLVLTDEVRRYDRLGKPWDWAASIGAAQAHTIAAWARRLASREGRALQLLCLAYVNGRDDEDGIMPFHVLDDVLHIRGQKNEEAAVPGTHVVRDEEDLPLIGLSTAAIRLVPALSRARDARFYQRVGEHAVSVGIPVLFAGSVLGHARAALERTGAIVLFPPAGGISFSNGGDVGVIAAPTRGLARFRHVPAEHVMASAPQAPAASGGLSHVAWISGPDADVLPPVTDQPGQLGRYLDDTAG